MRIRVAVFAAALALLAAASARADDWIATAGARLVIKPPYEGAEVDVKGVVASLDLRPADAPYRFTPPAGEATLALLDTTFVAAGPVLHLRGSRGDAGQYGGFSRIPVAIEPGAFVALWPARWLRLKAEARRGVSGHDGWVEDIGLDLIHTAEVKAGERWDASIGPRVGYGDARYMDTYFGVTPAEGAAHVPPLAAYEPGAGRRYAGAQAAAAYHLTPRWRVNVNLAYDRLGPTALASPVLHAAGSGDQFTAGVGFTYTFGLKL